MNDHPALNAVARLVEALNRGDVDAAVALYEYDAVFVPEPGTSVSGRAAIREALTGMVASRPKLETRRQEWYASTGVVLYLADWSMVAIAREGGAPIAMSGRSADVLREQPDGTWLIGIDNPWGTVGVETSVTPTVSEATTQR